MAGMMTAPIQPCLRPHYNRELTLAMQTNPHNNWPETDGLYQTLIEAERRAGRLAMISTGVPGLLKDERFAEAQLLKDERLAEAQLSKYPLEHREHMLELLGARQRHIEARWADHSQHKDNFDALLLIPHDVMNDVEKIGSEHVAPQAARLLLAIEQGWSIGMVDGPTLREAMGNMNTSLVASRIPGAASPLVYRGYDAGLLHESVHTDKLSVTEAVKLECDMLERSLMHDVVRTKLSVHTRPVQRQPYNPVFDLRKRR
jgi:hypothetical protein